MALFSAGDTFLYGEDANSLHLHVVVCEATDTAASLIIVSFNTVKEWTDKTLVLQAGRPSFCGA